MSARDGRWDGFERRQFDLDAMLLRKDCCEGTSVQSDVRERTERMTHWAQVQIDIVFETLFQYLDHVETGSHNDGD